MTDVSGHIIKGENIKVEGLFHLDLEQSATGMNAKNKEKRINAQAKIVETNPEFAVLEITCSCGTKTRVRCEYNNV